MGDDSIAALILAGGQSSRMGQDKALLPWQGAPLLQHVAQVAAACCASVTIFTPWVDRYRSVIQGPYHWLSESTPGRGPLLAFAEAWFQVDCPWVLLLACDLPLLEPSLLATWISDLSRMSPPPLALIPQTTAGWQPLCGFYHQSAQADLRRFIDQGGRSFQQWFCQLPVQPLVLPMVSPPLLYNCNTPADWQQIQTHASSPAPPSG